MAKKTKTPSLSDLPVNFKGASKAAPVEASSLTVAEQKTISQYLNACSRFKEVEAEKNELNGQVKDIGIKAWAKQALSGDTANVTLHGEGEDAVLFIVQKGCKAVTEEKHSAIVTAGLEDCLQPSCIQLKKDLNEETQNRIFQALVKEFGEEKAAGLINREYLVKDNALHKHAVEAKSVKEVEHLFTVLDPMTQIRKK